MGWHVHVVRSGSHRREGRVASWRTHTLGLGWVDSLVECGQASFDGGDGYPYRYSIRADDLIAEFAREAQRNAGSERRGLRQFDILRLGPAASECAPSDMLHLEAWDST